MIIHWLKHNNEYYIPFLQIDLPKRCILDLQETLNRRYQKKYLHQAMKLQQLEEEELNIRVLTVLFYVV